MGVMNRQVFITKHLMYSAVRRWTAYPQGVLLGLVI